MPADATDSMAFQSVLPGENGYMIPEDQAPLTGRDARRTSRNGTLGLNCCSTSKPRESGAHGMTFVGDGGGDYVVETRYKYIGKGGGQFALMQTTPEPQALAKPLACSLIPLLVGALVALAVFGWLFVPEESWHVTSKPQLSTGGHRSGSGHGIGASDPPPPPPPPPPPTWLGMTMKVSNVKYDVLRSPDQEAVLRRFCTEVSQGIALTAGHGLLPANVTVALDPGTDLVRATIHPPAAVNVRKLRTSMAANADLIAEGVLRSLNMMRGFEQISFETGKISVSEVDVELVADPPKATQRRLFLEEQRSELAVGDDHIQLRHLNEAGGGKAK